MPRGIPNKKKDEVLPISDPSKAVREEALLMAIRDILPSLRLYTDVMLKNKIGIDKVYEASLELASFVETGCESLKKNEQIALSCQVLRLLVVNLQSRKIPVTLNTIISNFSLIDHAVDSAFPGYMKAGLLKRIII